MTARDKSSAEMIDKSILQIIRLIPKGRVTSYGAIGNAVGLKSGARQVARAVVYLHEKHPTIPVHRVVNSAGKLTGPFEARKRLLQKEGIVIQGDRILDFNRIFWNPIEEVNF
jgi:methylated-DNA-protein-cysteine methyltransferase-like protein